MIFLSLVPFVAACGQQPAPPTGPAPRVLLPRVGYEQGPNGTRFYKRGGRSVLVFIHGVLGSAEGTWLNEDTGSYWPELVLNDTAFRNFDVYVVGYNTPKFSNALNLEELSGNLEVQLRSAGIFNYDAVFVVAHSMGGLIVKRILFGLAIDAARDLQKVKAVFLIATPNHGAEVARLAEILRSRNPQFGDMAEEGSGFLEMVDDLWIKLMNSRLNNRTRWPQAFCAYETKPTFGIRVVTEESARTQCDNSPYPLESDHLGVVKPGSYTLPPYPWIAYQVKAVGDTNRVASPAFVTPAVAEATLTRHLVTSRDTLIVIGRKDTTFVVAAQHCAAGCITLGNAKFSELTIRAPADYILENPSLKCVDRCSSVNAHQVSQASRAMATARVAVSDAPTTWNLSAELAEFRETFSFSVFPPQRLVAGQEVTVSFPVNAKAVQLTLRSALGVEVVDPTNLTGHEPFDLIAWEIDSAGTKILHLRFNGRWESGPIKLSR